MMGLKNRTIETIINLSRRFGFAKAKKPGILPSRFLIVSTTGIGDTLWGTPAIKVLKERYPKGYIALLTTTLGEEILRGNPDIDRFFIFRRGFRIPSLLNLLKGLRQERFDIAFIFHTSDRIILPIVFFTGVSQIIGVYDQNKGLDFILSKAIRQEDIHGIDMRLRLVKEVGVSYKKGLSPAIYLSKEDRERASDFLKDSGFDNNSLIVGLHPGAQKPYKCWPRERFIETGKRLVNDTGCRIIVTGDRKEKRLCEDVASKISGAISVAGEISLRETAAIIERMAVFITNDTGPMHMAFALGTPTVALFCPTEPRLCGPYNIKGVIMIKKPIVCNPCVGKRCENPVCMEQIIPDEVIEKVKSLLMVKRIYADIPG